MIDRCGVEAEKWVARCAESTGVDMRLESCPAGVAIVQAGRLRIEISTSEAAFRRVGKHGFSPIGSFADWKSEPADVRNAFDAVTACATRDAPDALIGRDVSPPASSGAAPRPAFPWLPLAIVVALCVALRRVPLRAIGVAVAAMIGTIALRRLVFPVAFFHQNGQGPGWILFALQGDAGSYGPGYPELFGFIASHARRPDLAVFVAAQVLASTAVVSAYWLSRRLGSPRSTAVALAALVAVDPILLRTAQSESYYTPIVALLFAATAVLVCTQHRRVAIAGLVATALLIAQAARIHPLSWIACGLVPLPLLLTSRPRRAIGATLAIAVIAAPLVLPTMRVALRGSFGSAVGGARDLASLRLPVVLPVLAAAAGLLLVRRVRPWALRALAAVIVVGVAATTNVLRTNIPAVSAAYLHLFAAAAIAIAAAIPGRVALAAVAAFAIHEVRERSIVAPTTDNLELTWALEWRERLPPSARVASLDRAGQYVLILPLAGRDLPQVTTLEDRAPTHYYRSSLCVTAEGAARCAAFESRHVLQLIAGKRLPSRPSASWLPLPAGEIEVALFAVER